MIAAMDRNRVIGKGEGGVPWHLPRDVARFRSFADGKHLLMGRRTFEEMKGWFTNQTPIVLTHQPDYRPVVGRRAHSVEEAVTEAFEDGAAELMVCGGASVYTLALPYADELLLTLVDAADSFENSVVFPDYLTDVEWETLSEDYFDADEENSLAMTFLHLRRLSPSSLRPGRLHLI